jgi:hypothetical protein
VASADEIFNARNDIKGRLDGCQGRFNATKTFDGRNYLAGPKYLVSSRQS